MACLVHHTLNRNGTYTGGKHNPYSLMKTSLINCVAEEAGLNLTWSKIHEDTFSRDVAHIVLEENSNKEPQLWSY